MNDILLLNAQAQHQAGNLTEAARLYSDILRANPVHLPALQMLGFLHFQRDEFAAAERILARALALDPKDADALYNRGCALQALDKHREALECFTAALAIQPGDPDALHGRGRALHGLGRTQEALVSFDQAIARDPGHIEALIDKGIALVALERFADALTPLDAALARAPRDGAARVNRANALIHLKRYAEALADADAALAGDPNHAEAWHNRASALAGLRRHKEALAAYDRAVAIKPGNAVAWNNRGNTLIAMKRYSDALADIDRALALDPAGIEAHANRANALSFLKRFGEAIGECDTVLAEKPDHALGLNIAVHCHMYACDWRDRAGLKTRALAGLHAGTRTIAPFDAKGFVDSEKSNFQAARLWAQAECPLSPPLYRGERYRHDKLRLAYISTDFRSHAVGYLIAGVLECHDKNRFETTAISLSPSDKSETRARIAAAFDRFLDAEDKSDSEIANLLRDAEIDIAVDLNGYTGDGRPRVLAMRPAPVQVNYLGYPGTMAAPFMDYIVADRIVIPEENAAHYNEKIVYLPGSYQANDATRQDSGRAFTRRELGLPESGFVFCSFNNNYKIAPEMFGIWMRLLDAVPASVLWLLEDNAYATANLAREAELRGVAAARLIFAPRMSPPDHLARHRMADLFLDTLPYNAHTTASDALWMGLPLVTCMGESFPGRVAASVAAAAGAPELIAGNPAEYERLALHFARDPHALAEIKAKLVRNRATCALFDTARFTRHLEAAYTMMHRRHAQGLAPATFAVPE